ncbi:tetratricopeptide repeat protein [Pedobacter heparinus]|uniref:tetratricopeptide repeat protein n=1 Tax=Pedobacter heparinus TaxID=984 RepID=UPI002930F8D7|nr:DUF5107 domain-containing protein [Pedobacter heparinus]
MNVLKLVAAGCLLFSNLQLWAQAAQQVEMRVEKLTLPTYETGKTEENPLFYVPEAYQGAQRHIYPYPFSGQITNQKVNKDYTAVILENEYTKLCITPEMGGRIYYAIDKTNNYNIVYYNHVVKPALIGMAGAWTSGGAEWNIPHHHRPTSFLPVDYTMVSNADGSKTVWVGEYEKRHQTRWLVGITLAPGKAYIKTEFRYLNVTPVQNSFLFWANTAVHANENYQVIFPPDVEKAVFHGKTEFANWPVPNQFYQGIDFTKGEDISWWKNTKEPTSFFIWETKQDFLGGIDHGKHAGTVKIGDRTIFKGKKFWNWGPNEVGRSWDKKLTDEDGPYLELMMGGYSDNQPDYSFINPMSSKQGTIFYYGIKQMNNIKEANADMAINLEQKGTEALIEINATSVLKNARVVISWHDREVFKAQLDVDPAKPYTKSIALPAGIVFSELKIQVFSADGNELISWQQAPKKAEAHPAGYKSPLRPAAYTSEDELWLTGLRLEQFGNAMYEPEKYYAEALRRDSIDVMNNTQMGLSLLKKGIYDQAEHYLTRAKQQVTSNFTKPKFSEPLYYLGVVYLKQGKYEEARELLYQAAWSYEWASPAYTLLARLEARRGNWAKAGDNAERALLTDALNIEALNLKAIAFRKAAHYEDALKTVNGALAVDPLNFTAMNELYLLSAQLQTGRSVREQMAQLKERLRFEPDNYLETADRYIAAGLYREASDLLTLATQATDDKLRNNPMIFYGLGYCAHQEGKIAEARDQFNQAARLGTDGVFPYGDLALNALKLAVSQHPKDANAHYLLGNIYADYQSELAIAEWGKAIKLNGNKAIYYRNLAYAKANYTPDIQGAIADIMKAISLNGNDPRYFMEADDYLSYARTPPEKMREFLSKNAAAIKDNVDVKVIDIRLKNFFGDYEGSIALLEKLNYRTEEGSAFNVHVHWFDAHLLRGMAAMKGGKYAEAEKDYLNAMTFPASLESERDAKVGVALYYLGVNSRLAGAEKKAVMYFNQMLAYTYEPGWGAGSSPEVNFYKGMASAKLGKVKAAEGFFKQLMDAAGKKRAYGENDGASENSSGRASASIARRKINNSNQANVVYARALGYLGLGDLKKANAFFTEVLKINPVHQGAKIHSSPDWRSVALIK